MIEKIRIPSLTARRYAETFSVFLEHSREYQLMDDELVRVIREELQGRSGLRLLDIGAGTGCVIESLAARPGIELGSYEAFEPNPSHLGKLRTALARLTIPATLHAEGFTEHTELAGGYDLVLFSHSLYWMADPALALLRAARALGPGGVVLALIQGPYGLYALFPLFEPLIERTSPMLQNNRLSSHELVAGLRSRGVEPSVRMLPTPIDMTQLFEPGAEAGLAEFISFCLQLEFTDLPERLRNDIVAYIRGACVAQDGRLFWYLPNASVMVRGDALPTARPV